jgi:hypothetical protein
LFFNSTYPVNYIAKEIFWAEINRVEKEEMVDIILLCDKPTTILLIASIARCELNSNMCVRR